MTTGAAQPQQCLDWQHQLLGHIDQLACGRIEDLRVAYFDGAGIVLSGQAPSYHLKQIAQEAAFAFYPSMPLSNKISVSLNETCLSLAD